MFRILQSLPSGIRKDFRVERMELPLEYPTTSVSRDVSQPIHKRDEKINPVYRGDRP